MAKQDSELTGASAKQQKAAEQTSVEISHCSLMVLFELLNRAALLRGSDPHLLQKPASFDNL